MSRDAAPAEERFGAFPRSAWRPTAGQSATRELALGRTGHGLPGGVGPARSRLPTPAPRRGCSPALRPQVTGPRVLPGTNHREGPSRNSAPGPASDVPPVPRGLRQLASPHEQFIQKAAGDDRQVAVAVVCHHGGDRQGPGDPGCQGHKDNSLDSMQPGSRGRAGRGVWRRPAGRQLQCPGSLAPGQRQVRAASPQRETRRLQVLVVGSPIPSPRPRSPPTPTPRGVVNTLLQRDPLLPPRSNPAGHPISAADSPELGEWQGHFLQCLPPPQKSPPCPPASLVRDTHAGGSEPEPIPPPAMWPQGHSWPPPGDRSVTR